MRQGAATSPALGRPPLWEVLRQTPDAVPPLCPHGDACGGCPLQTLPQARQLAWKRTLVLDALERVGGLPRPSCEALLGPVAASPATTRFRNKWSWPLARTQQACRVGLRERGGRRVTPVPGCTLLPPEARTHGRSSPTPSPRSGAPQRPERLECPGAAPSTRTAQAEPDFSEPDASGRDAEQAGGFWRFFDLTRRAAWRICAARAGGRCLTSPSDTPHSAGRSTRPGPGAAGRFPPHGGLCA